MKIGYHCEGWDYLILHCLVCRLLGVHEADLEPTQIRSDETMGMDQVLFLAENALRKFYYGEWTLAAVIEVDNDGRQDLRHTGAQQDTAHPRHWVHRQAGQERGDHCRVCLLNDRVNEVRPGLTVPGYVPGTQWPVVICVPVEAVEAWLLAARGIEEGDDRLARDAERRPAGADLKEALYGSRRATRSSVERIALPLLRGLPDVSEIGKYSQSFRRFACHVRCLRPSMDLVAERLGVKL